MKTIWSNDVDVVNSIIDDIREEYPEADDYDLYRIAAELNDDYLEDERINLNIELRNPILIIADLGLWNGRHYGYHGMKIRIMRSSKIKINRSMRINQQIVYFGKVVA